LKSLLAIFTFLTVCIQFNTAFPQNGEAKQFDFADTTFSAVDFYIFERSPNNFRVCWPDQDVATNDFLDAVVDFMKKNQKIRKIEIGVHTDSRPIPMTNDTLSLRTAVSLRNYLVANGVDPARVIAKGYGGNSPRTLEKDTTGFLDPIKYKSCKDNKFAFIKGTVLTDEYIRSLPSNCEKEAAYQLNRRTVIMILEVDSTIDGQ
jgi:hypothetical protein